MLQPKTTGSFGLANISEHPPPSFLQRAGSGIPARSCYSLQPQPRVNSHTKHTRSGQPPPHPSAASVTRKAHRLTHYHTHGHTRAYTCPHAYGHVYSAPLPPPTRTHVLTCPSAPGSIPLPGLQGESLSRTPTSHRPGCPLRLAGSPVDGLGALCASHMTSLKGKGGRAEGSLPVLGGHPGDLPTVAALCQGGLVLGSPERSIRSWLCGLSFRSFKFFVSKMEIRCPPQGQLKGIRCAPHPAQPGGRRRCDGEKERGDFGAPRHGVGLKASGRQR